MRYLLTFDAAGDAHSRRHRRERAHRSPGPGAQEGRAVRDSGQCVSAAPTAGAGGWCEICAATLGGVLQELPSQAWRFIAAKFNSSCWSFPVRTTCVMRRDWLPYSDLRPSISAESLPLMSHVTDRGPKMRLCSHLSRREWTSFREWPSFDNDCKFTYSFTAHMHEIPKYLNEIQLSSTSVDLCIVARCGRR